MKSEALRVREREMARVIDSRKLIYVPEVGRGEDCNREHEKCECLHSHCAQRKTNAKTDKKDCRFGEHALEAIAVGTRAGSRAI